MIAVLRVLLLVLLPALAQAEVLSLSAGRQPLLPAPAMQVWADKDGHADFTQVSALPEQAWQPVMRRDASFGYGPTAYWLRLQLHNPQAQPAHWIFLAGNPLLDFLDVYGLDAERVYRAGDQRPFGARWVEHRQFVLPLELAAGETRTLYLRMQTAGSAHLGASLLTQDAFARHEQQALLLQGLFFGALGVMFVYNLLIFGITRDRDYLWYSLFVGSFGLYQFTQLGFGFQWLWPEALWWQQRSFPLLTALATACAGLFTYGFLDLGNSARWYARVGRLLIGACLGCALLACLAPYTLALLSSFLLVGLCSLAAMVFTLLRWTEGYRPARLFAFGWFILIVASQVHVLSGSGLLPYGLPTLYAQQIGSLVELVLFAIALAARIRQTQLAHAATQQQLLAQERELRLEQAHGLGLQQQINEGLEQRVQERTQALEQALQELSAANRRLAALSRQDGLTGLLNRPTFDEELQHAWARADRGQRPLALLMLDLDHFKQINDSHGHLAGDACLQHVARRLRLGLRGSDLLARFGGEEFVVILPDTELAGARELAERLRADLAARPCQYGPQRIALSLSIGVAAGMPSAGLASATLLHQADQALYAAKAAGRNKVENYRVESYEASALGEA